MYLITNYRPIPTLKHALWNYIKSLMFMASYVGALKYLLCFTKNVRGTIDGKFNFYIIQLHCNIYNK